MKQLQDERACMLRACAHHEGWDESGWGPQSDVSLLLDVYLDRGTIKQDDALTGLD
jgi:hypothetical protein